MSNPLRAVLTTALRDALTQLDPARLVHDALPPLPPRRARVRVIAAGKAASAMAQGALRRWPDRIEDVLVITVDPRANAAAPVADPRLTTRFAAHPLPDLRSVAAASEALARANDLAAEDLLLVLISGGASALLAAPSAGVTLEQKNALIRALINAGAPIRDLNLVRRHISKVKGGHLAAAALPARVLTLLLSDVIDGAPHDIGSGPSVPDPTTVRDAQRVLERYLVPQADWPIWSESLKPETPVSLIHVAATFPASARIRARILADTNTLAQAVGDALRRARLRVSVERPEEGAADAIVERRVARARSLAPGEAVVVGCEPTLRLSAERGLGGRAGWIALSAMRHLPGDVSFLCAASDGVDGSSGGGGALVAQHDATRCSLEAIDRALRDFDDAAIHRHLGTQLEGGPTGHNLADIHVLVRALA